MAIFSKGNAFSYMPGVPIDLQRHYFMESARRLTGNNARGFNTNFIRHAGSSMMSQAGTGLPLSMMVEAVAGRKRIGPTYAGGAPSNLSIRGFGQLLYHYESYRTLTQPNEQAVFTAAEQAGRTIHGRGPVRDYILRNAERTLSKTLPTGVADSLRIPGLRQTARAADRGYVNSATMQSIEALNLHYTAALKMAGASGDDIKNATGSQLAAFEKRVSVTTNKEGWVRFAVNRKLSGTEKIGWEDNAFEWFVPTRKGGYEYDLMPHEVMNMLPDPLRKEMGISKKQIEDLRATGVDPFRNRKMTGTYVAGWRSVGGEAQFDRLMAPEVLYGNVMLRMAQDPQYSNMSLTEFKRIHKAAYTKNIAPLFSAANDSVYYNLYKATRVKSVMMGNAVRFENYTLDMPAFGSKKGGSDFTQSLQPVGDWENTFPFSKDPRRRDIIRFSQDAQKAAARETLQQISGQDIGEGLTLEHMHAKGEQFVDKGILTTLTPGHYMPFGSLASRQPWQYLHRAGLVAPNVKKWVNYQKKSRTFARGRATTPFVTTPWLATAERITRERTGAPSSLMTKMGMITSLDPQYLIGTQGGEGQFVISEPMARALATQKGWPGSDIRKSVTPSGSFSELEKLMIGSPLYIEGNRGSISSIIPASRMVPGVHLYTAGLDLFKHPAHLRTMITSDIIEQVIAGTSGKKTHTALSEIAEILTGRTDSLDYLGEFGRPQTKTSKSRMISRGVPQVTLTPGANLDKDTLRRIEEAAEKALGSNYRRGFALMHKNAIPSNYDIRKESAMRELGMQRPAPGIIMPVEVFARATTIGRSTNVYPITTSGWATKGMRIRHDFISNLKGQGGAGAWVGQQLETLRYRSTLSRYQQEQVRRFTSLAMGAETTESILDYKDLKSELGATERIQSYEKLVTKRPGMSDAEVRKLAKENVGFLHGSIADPAWKWHKPGLTMGLGGETIQPTLGGQKFGPKMSALHLMAHEAIFGAALADPTMRVTTTLRLEEQIIDWVQSGKDLGNPKFTDLVGSYNKEIWRFISGKKGLIAGGPRIGGAAYLAAAGSTHGSLSLRGTPQLEMGVAEISIDVAHRLGMLDHLDLAEQELIKAGERDVFALLAREPVQGTTSVTPWKFRVVGDLEENVIRVNQAYARLMRTDFDNDRVFAVFERSVKHLTDQDPAWQFASREGMSMWWSDFTSRLKTDVTYGTHEKAVYSRIAEETARTNGAIVNNAASYDVLLGMSEAADDGALLRADKYITAMSNATGVRPVTNSDLDVLVSKAAIGPFDIVKSQYNHYIEKFYLGNAEATMHGNKFVGARFKGPVPTQKAMQQAASDALSILEKVVEEGGIAKATAAESPFVTLMTELSYQIINQGADKSALSEQRRALIELSENYHMSWMTAEKSKAIGFFGGSKKIEGDVLRERAGNAVDQMIDIMMNLHKQEGGDKAIQTFLGRNEWHKFVGNPDPEEAAKAFWNMVNEIQSGSPWSPFYSDMFERYGLLGEGFDITKVSKEGAYGKQDMYAMVKAIMQPVDGAEQPSSAGRLIGGWRNMPGWGKAGVVGGGLFLAGLAAYHLFDDDATTPKEQHAPGYEYPAYSSSSVRGINPSYGVGLGTADHMSTIDPGMKMGYNPMYVPPSDFTRTDPQPRLPYDVGGGEMGAGAAVGQPLSVRTAYLGAMNDDDNEGPGYQMNINAGSDQINDLVQMGSQNLPVGSQITIQDSRSDAVTSRAQAAIQLRSIQNGSIYGGLV